MKRALAALVLVACSRRSEPGPSPAPPPSAAPSAAITAAPADAASPVVDAGTDPCAPVPDPRTATSIGHTSVVFKVVLPDGRKAAWKPDALKRRGRYRGEVAAYRLGVALGIAANVPPACVQSFSTKALTTALAGDSHGMNLLVDEVVTDGPTIHGALIPWIDGLQLWALEKDPARTEVRGWLHDTAVPDAMRDRARQASDLVVFDHLTTNWDRYSGGNVGLDRTGATVLFIDNDAAFMTSPPASSIAASRARLGATTRFSRRLVQRLSDLDEAGLTKALGDEGDHPLLDAATVHGLELRRQEVLRAIAAQQKIRGDDATLFFD